MGRILTGEANIKIPLLPRALFTHLPSLQVWQYCTMVYFWHTFSCHFNTNLYRQSLKESDWFIVIFLLVLKGYRLHRLGDGTERILIPGTLLFISHRHLSTRNWRAKNSLDLFIWFRAILPDILWKNPYPSFILRLIHFITLWIHGETHKKKWLSQVFGTL